MAKAPLTGIVQLLLWRLSQNVYFSPHCTFHEVSPDGTRKNKKKPKPVLNKFNKRLCGSVHLITRLDSNMIRAVLLLFCMSAAIYGSLSCPSSKKSKLVALPETQKDPKEHNALRNPG
uniref:Secreted protein n=1 Tax=Macrostomum lignano TaxID=282301 RepID=A0A1I8GYJ6_9PLAT